VVAGPVIIGVIQAPFGVKGWVKLRSYTDPIENILQYSPWVYANESGERRLLHEGQRNGDNLVARFVGIDDRDAAATLRGLAVYADRTRFPPAAPGEYYRIDLMGLSVTNLQGVQLGVISDIMTTGAHDVMILAGDRERLVPFVQGRFVREVNLAAGYVLVDWDEDF
jgi:16S rRNA processing protein RimM